MDTTSYWSDTSPVPGFGTLKKRCKVDVVIIGAGITGITAAYLLKKAGCKVALIDRGACGGFDSLNTTAHLTYVTDLRLSKLVDHFGKAAAAKAWEGGRQAINQIYTNIQEQNIKCDFTWGPAYLHAPQSSSMTEAKRLQSEARLAVELGFPAEFERRVPFIRRPGIKFSNQAKFHPAKYLSALLAAIPGKGSHVFAKTEAGAIQAKPLTVHCGKHRIHASYLVVATHTPLMGKAPLVSATLLQTKLFLYTTYALGARIPVSLAPEASFWDTGSPYQYLRIDRHRGFDYAILGGEDHKTGQIDSSVEAYHRLERAFHQLFPRARVDYRWSGQVIETPDGLPYIGENADRQFVATGFSGNGITFGTLGAMMAADAFLGRGNPWQELFDVHRKPFHGGAWKYLHENSDLPLILVRDRLAAESPTKFAGLRRDQGKVLLVNGKKTAAYRDKKGRITLCSPICTHLQCVVGWNDAEKTWDCPCHGSRFAATGEVLAGPAEAPLEKLPLPKIKMTKPRRSARRGRRSRSEWLMLSRNPWDEI